MSERVPLRKPDAVWPDSWERILLSEVAFYRRLPPRDLDRLRPTIARFLREKDFVGVGVEIDDRMRLLVAASACRLALNLPGETYTRLTLVELHATGFEHQGRVLGTASVYHVALALDSLAEALRDERADNVGYHEFAHVLDDSDGVFDGVPPLLARPGLRLRWLRTLADDLARLRAAVAAGEPTLLDERAAKDPAELFAYATEKLFADPIRLSLEHRDLYCLLVAYYAQDPLAA